MLRKPKILIVDDTPQNLVALAALLTRDDAEVLQARSGAEALELLLTFHDVALALVDVRMPEMDGFELAELMRGTARTRAIPIIFLTADGSLDEPRLFRGYESGAVDFLLKPLQPQILQNKVAVFLELFRQRQMLSQQLSDLSRAERTLRESDRRKNEFLAVLSHELRNPLTPIRNSIFILQRAEPGGDQARRAHAILERQVTHLSRLVDDLLDVTRITRGKVQLRPVRMDLAAAVRETVEDYRATFVSGDVHLKLELPSEALWIMGDSTRIAQLVGNLLSNAAKYTPAGGHVEVALHKHGHLASLTVRDDGVGIPPEMVEALFEPFSQADRTLDRSRGGLGLGLTLVRGLAELHGGTVRVSSGGAGKGAEFTATLPLDTASTEHPAPAGFVPGTAPQRHRVLVIEDNRDSGDSLRDALAAMGHEVSVARDGPEGLSLAASFAPTVVLCDLGLPRMSGYEVAQRLRADGRFRELPLIALSGYASAEDRERAFAAGFSDHVAKPASMEALGRMLADLPGLAWH